MRRKVLPGIRHYNEGWFRSCYYHQLIAGLSYYGIPAQAVICNYAMEVVPADRLTDFRFVERDILNERDFSALVGVSLERRRPRDVVRAAVECVDRGMPLIVALDNFYLPYRADYYRKSHYLHFVLVYGYDPDLGALIAGEHEYTTSYDFQERAIPFAVLQESYEGFRAYQPQFQWGVVRLRKDPSVPERRREGLKARLRGALTGRDFAQYGAFYRRLAEEGNCGYELAALQDAAIRSASFFPALVHQCRVIGAGTPLAELAETVWQDACFMRSIVIKARCKEEPESIVSPRMREKAREIDASLEEMNGWIRRC